jgi:hypothetical protein
LIRFRGERCKGAVRAPHTTEYELGTQDLTDTTIYLPITGDMAIIANETIK